MNYFRCAAMSGGEEAVQATNDDATLCKVSAVSLGYWTDSFVRLMVKSNARDRRAPEIHLGYWADNYIQHMIRSVTRGMVRVVSAV